MFSPGWSWFPSTRPFGAGAALCPCGQSARAPNPVFVLSSRATSSLFVIGPRSRRWLRRVRLFLLRPRAAKLPTPGWGRREGLTGRALARVRAVAPAGLPDVPTTCPRVLCPVSPVPVQRPWSLAAKARRGPDTQVCGRHQHTSARFCPGPACDPHSRPVPLGHQGQSAPPWPLWAPTRQHRSSERRFRIEAAVLCVPVWLGFLESRGLQMGF